MDDFMAKISIDKDACVGCGVCEQVCPEAFAVEDGVAVVKGSSCDQHDIQDVAGQCPVEAIKVE